MRLQGKEKILFLLEEIDKEKKNTPEGDIIEIDFVEKIEYNLNLDDLKKILKKLEKEGIIKDHNFKENYLRLFVTGRFYDHYIDLKNELNIKITVFERDTDPTNYPFLELKQKSGNDDKGDLI